MSRTKEENLLREYVKSSIVLSKSVNIRAKAQLKNERLIRRQVHKILKEEFAGGFAGADSPFGISFTGDGKEFLNVFLGPFKDAYKVGVAGIKKISISTYTLTKILRGVGESLYSSSRVHYSKIFDEEKKKLEAVKQQYKDVYDRIDSTFKNGDAALLAFMASPSTFITYMGTKLAAKTAKRETIHLLSALTGGWSDDKIEQASQKSKEFGRWLLDGSIKGTPKEKSEKEVKFKRWYEKEIVNPSVEQAKPKIEEMKKASKEIYESALKKAYDYAEKVLSAKSIEQIEKILGSEMDSETKKKIEEAKKLPQDQQKTIIDQIRAGQKSSLVKPLRDKIGELKSQGQTDNSDQVVAYVETIRKIQQL